MHCGMAFMLHNSLYPEGTLPCTFVFTLLVPELLYSWVMMWVTGRRLRMA